MTMQIASHSQESVSYSVTLDGEVAHCTCPDHTHRHRDCKHIRQARSERHEHLVMIAGTLEDSELERLIAKYAALPGKGAVVFAMLCELADREALDKTPAPEEVPAPVTEGEGQFDQGLGHYVGVCGSCAGAGRVFIGHAPAIRWACRACNQPHDEEQRAPSLVPAHVAAIIAAAQALPTERELRSIFA